jgi:hypothetical protein
MGFEQVVQKLSDLGGYDIIVFILATTLVYAILRKTKLLGESIVVNGLISLLMGFLVLTFPPMFGMDFTKPLVGFFGQAFVVLIILFMGFLIAGFFYPNIMEKMTSGLKGGGAVWWFVIFVLLLAIFSRLFDFIVQPLLKLLGGGKDLFIGMFFLLLFIGVLAAITTGGKD